MVEARMTSRTNQARRVEALGIMAASSWGMAFASRLNSIVNVGNVCRYCLDAMYLQSKRFYASVKEAGDLQHVSVFVFRTAVSNFIENFHDGLRAGFQRMVGFPRLYWISDTLWGFLVRPSWWTEEVIKCHRAKGDGKSPRYDYHVHCCASYWM